MATRNNTPADNKRENLDNAWLKILERLEPAPDASPEDRTLAAASMGMILASGNGCSDRILGDVVNALVAASVESPPTASASPDVSKYAALNSNAVSALEAFVGPSSNVEASSFARALVTKRNMDEIFDRLSVGNTPVGKISSSITRSCLTYIALATFLTQADTPGVADVAGAIYGEMLSREFFSVVVPLAKASEDPELRVRAGEILGAMVSTSADLKKMAIDRHVAKTLMANIASEKSRFGGGDEDNLGPTLAPQSSEETQEKRKLFEQYHFASDELCLQCVGMVLKEDTDSTMEIATSPTMIGWLSRLMGMGSPIARLIFQALGTSEYKTQLADSMRQAQQQQDRMMSYTN